MTPENRSQDVRRIEYSLEATNQRINGIKVKLHAQSDDLAQLKAMMKDIATQQLVIKQTLQSLSGEASSSQNTRSPQHPASAIEPNGGREGPQPIYRSRRPRRNFPTFEGEEVHKWLYKCNQYFDLEEIPEADKLKLASYYLDGMTLYWHQNYTRNLEGHGVTWAEYVDALCCRFGGKKDPFEELTEHKQEGDLEGYIKDFDELWNRAQISEKQALVFFLGGGEWLKRAMLPKLIFWFCGEKNLPLTEATWEEAEEFSWWFPSFHLEDKVDVMEGALSRTKEKKKVKGNKRKVEARI